MASSGNFCTLNPLVTNSGSSTMNGGTFSVGNLKYAMSGEDGFRSNYAITHKSYCEVYINSIGSYGGTIGFGSYQNEVTYEDMVTFQMNYQSGRIYHYKGASAQSPSIANIGGTVSTTNVIMMAYDPATYKWWVGVDGTWRNSGDPANGTGFIFQGSSTMFEDMQGVFWGGWKGGANGLTCHWNFGQDSTFGGTITAGGNADENGFGDFKYTPPTGFLALCSGNEVISSDIDPAQTDDNFPGKQSEAVTFTGNGGTNNITGVGFQADLAFFKNRGTANSWIVVDSSRGGTGSGTKSLNLNGSGAESTGAYTTWNGFTSDGFNLSGGGTGTINQSSANMYGMLWRANGGTTTSDSSGDITVTRQSNTAGGFAILTYTGNGSADQTIAHGLGKTPAWIITKNRSSSSHWAVWHHQYTGYYGQLESTIAWASDSSQFYTDGMTSNFIGVKGSGATNESGDNMLAYVWSQIDGYSKFGKYTGNGNDGNGPYIYTGFRPRMLWIKDVSQGNEWFVQDTARETFNPTHDFLEWDTADAEQNNAHSKIDFLSNGFKCKGNSGRFNDTSTYVYGAFGDVPFKYNNTF